MEFPLNIILYVIILIYSRHYYVASKVAYILLSRERYENNNNNNYYYVIIFTSLSNELSIVVIRPNIIISIMWTQHSIYVVTSIVIATQAKCNILVIIIASKLL